jgi:DNA-binding beta-propeller fold protein YncE
LFQFGEGSLASPHGLCLDGEEKIFVADRDNHRVVVYDQQGKFLYQFGKKGKGTNQFQHPWGLAIDGKGRLLVSDHSNNRIQRFLSLQK